MKTEKIMKRFMTMLLVMLMVLPGICTAADEAAEQTGNQDLAAAFEADELVLTEAGMPDISAEDFEFPDEMWEFMGGEIPEDPYAYLEQALSMMETGWFSLSPAGNSGFLSMGDTVITFYEGKYHILYPSFSQGVADEYNNLAQYAEMAMSRMPQLLGTEGVIYSSDGRYAAIGNTDYVLKYANLFIDPILIDMSTGAMILTATFPDKIMDENAGAMTTACFSADNRYFYYFLFRGAGETNSTLCRYDLQSGETLVCYSGTENLYYPRLSETDEGNLIILQDVRKSEEYMNVVKLTEEQEGWTAEQYLFDLSMRFWYADQLMYSADSGYAVVTGSVILTDKFRYGFQCIKPDENMEGLNRYLVITKEDEQLLALSAEEIMDIMDQFDPSESVSAILMPYQIILNTKLSPDGQYLLLHTLNNGTRENSEKIPHLYMVRLTDLKLKEVTGIDPADIPYDAAMRQYKPGIEWNTDMVLIGIKDGIRAFRFQDIPG